TSGWQRLMISSRGGRNRASWRSSRGSVSPHSESRRRRNHGPPKSGIPIRKKNRMHTPPSCKIDYLLRSNHLDRSIASSFFTDDHLHGFESRLSASDREF